MLLFKKTVQLFWTITSIKDSFKTIIILLTLLDQNLKSASFLLLLLAKESSSNTMGVVLNQIYSGWFNSQNFIMKIIVKQRCLNSYHFHDMCRACAFIKMLINNATIFIRPVIYQIDRSLIKGPLYFTNIVSRAARTKKIVNNVWFTKQWSKYNPKCCKRAPLLWCHTLFWKQSKLLFSS